APASRRWAAAFCGCAAPTRPPSGRSRAAFPWRSTATAPPETCSTSAKPAPSPSSPHADRPLPDQLAHHLPCHVRQAEVAPLVAIGEARVVDAELVQQRR